MRNYIILNGNNSNTISGLLIQSLPPISKPLMRTAIEEIDGRDGDIVTNLGYSAYDKEVSIGLYGTYDVDEVIKYFNDNMTGQVTFSNEPDKYYNYEIINQIDFERLIRFKTAIVTLHCQPFKYPTEETPIEITPTFIEEEGEELTLNDTEYAPMQVNLKGNTSQASDPTPDSPVDVNVVSGDNTINIFGNNIFDSSFNNTTHNNISISYNDGVITLNGTANASSGVFLNDTLNNILPKGTFTLILQYISGSNTGTSRIALGDSSLAITSDNEHRYFSFAIPNNNTSNIVQTIDNTKNKIIEKWGIYINNAITFNNYKFRLYITKGTYTSSNIPEYKPYQEVQSQLISLGNIELNKISTYQDYIYKENDRWYLHKEIGKVVLDGVNNSFTAKHSLIYSSTKGFYRVELPNKTTSTSYPSGSTDAGYCDLFSYKSGGAQVAFDNNSNGIWWERSTNRNYIILEITTLEGANEWLKTHNTTIYYILDTPTDTEITDTNLINQLNNLKNNVKSYDPITHITQNANDKPFILNATAVQKGSDTGIVDNDGNIYSKPTLDIEGNGIIAIYLNGNQMFSVDLSNSSECIIDVTNLEAYDPETNELMNRQVTGDYSKFILPVGENQVKVSGNVTKATITDYVRWL